MKFNKKTLTALVVSLFIGFLGGCEPSNETKSPEISKVSSIDGSSIAYGVLGQGDTTLVFIHCWTCNHQFWQTQIEHFSKKHKVAWLDLAGHGASKSQRNHYTMQAFGQDVAAVVDAIDGGQVILVGHSMGGPVAIEAAKLLGDKVIGVVGVDTFYTGFPYPQSEDKIEEFVKPFKQDFKATSEQMVRSMFTPTANPTQINSIVEQLSTADQEMAVSAMYEIFRWNIKNNPAVMAQHNENLRNINSAPTGKEPGLHKSVVMIPGVGHFIPQVKPDEFNQVLETVVLDY